MKIQVENNNFSSNQKGSVDNDTLNISCLRNCIQKLHNMDFHSSVECLDSFLSKMNYVILIKDLQSSKVKYVSRNSKTLWGYDFDFMRDSNNFSNRNIVHPDDVIELRKNELEVLNKIRENSISGRKKIRFSFTYRLCKADGNYIWILEQNSVVKLDKLNNVTHLLTACINISSNIDLNKKLLSFSVSHKKSLPLIKHSENLSKREIEIIRLIAHGENSKSIACKLSISFNTVNTHRQNIFAKTKVRSAGELVQYANNHNLV